MPSNSISEHLFFKNFLGGHAPRSHSISMLHMLIVLCTTEHNSWLPQFVICFTLRNIIQLCPSPSNTLHLILSPLDQNPERNPDAIYCHVFCALGIAVSHSAYYILPYIYAMTTGTLCVCILYCCMLGAMGTAASSIACDVQCTVNRIVSQGAMSIVLQQSRWQR